MAVPVQQGTWDSGSSATFTYGSAVAAGALLVFVGGGTSSGTINSISDSINGAWTRAIQSATGGGISSEIWYVKNSGAGTPIVTPTIGRFANAGGNFQEYSGAATTGGADATAAFTNSSTTTPVTGSITPSASAIIVAGMTFNFGNYSSGPTNSYTRLTQSSFFGTDLIESACKAGVTGSTSTGWTVSFSSSQETTIAAFLEASTPTFNAGRAKGATSGVLGTGVF